MTFDHPLQKRLPAWSDWLTLALMSLAAPWVAGYIHSVFVFQRGIRLYNAEVGGIYFGSMPQPQPSLWSVFLWIGGCGLPAAITFALLLPFRKRVVYRWLVWFCS